MKFGAYEDIVHITSFWKGERFPDGRPKVSDDILGRLRRLTLEEAHIPLWNAGYIYQFEGRLRTTHPGVKLVGRAVTGVMMPKRPDLDETLMTYGLEQEGRKGFFNQWIIDQLVEDDVVVIDMFDKIYGGTFVGGNLSTAVATRTKRGGSVIWGGIRDLEQVVKIPNIQTYYRGTDPMWIKDVTLVGMNSPCMIGGAVCLPGDVVFGTMSGVLFIPPHMAELVVISAEKSHVKDIYAFEMLEQRAYTTAQVDAPWTTPMYTHFLKWMESSPQAEGYRHLDWSEDLKEARDREASGDTTPQVRA